MTEVRAETRAVRCGSVRGSGLRLGCVMTLDWCLSSFPFRISLSLSLAVCLIYLSSSLLWPTLLLLLQCLLHSSIHSHTLSPEILPQFPPLQTNPLPLFPFLGCRKDEVLAQQVEENCTSQDRLQGQKGLSPHR